VHRFATCLLALIALSPFASRAEAPAHRPIVIGYVMDGATLPPIDARKLDAINFAFAHVDDTHGIVLRGDTATTAVVASVSVRFAPMRTSAMDTEAIPAARNSDCANVRRLGDPMRTCDSHIPAV